MRWLLFPFFLALLGMCLPIACAADEAEGYLKDGKLTARIEVRVLQGGFAGFTGAYYAIESDGSWNTGAVGPREKKGEPKAKGKLSDKQLAQLAGDLASNDLANLPNHGEPRVNPKVTELSFGKKTARLQMNPGKAASEEDKAIRARYAEIVRAVKAACRDEKPDAADASPSRAPNFIVVLVDDLGYSDLGPFGSTKHRTPVIDQMAKEGMRLTDFYSVCSVCTPSRAGLMTGCYPRRVNMHVDENNLCVLFPGARKGLNPDEITIAEVLKPRGYATGCFGKWHLGDHPNFLPTRQGFDEYFGIPYSNDMHRNEIPLPLVRDTAVIEAPVQQDMITQRLTEEAVRFIKANKDRPFFVYLPHTAVHVPLHPGAAFKGKSQDGPYGDWVEELDWSMGELFKTLKAEGVDQNTLVVLTSDNGSQRPGNNDPLRGVKGQTDEGGMRMPCIVRWPGKIAAGSKSAEVTAMIDLLPTFATLAGTTAPQDRIIDGRDIWPILSGQPGAKSPHEAFYYYQMDQLQAVRSGAWKLFVPMEAKKRNWRDPEGNTPLKLFNLVEDIHEDKDVSDANPEVVARLLALAEKAREDLGDVDRPGKNQRPAGWVDKPSPRLRERLEN